MATLTPPPVSSPLVDIQTSKDRQGNPVITARLNSIWQTWFNNIFLRTGAYLTSPYAPSDATYIVRTPSSDLIDEQSLSTLSSGFLKVTTGTGSLSSTGNGQILTNDLADNSVIFQKLSPNLQPSHVVKFGAIYTTVGGSATETISVPGVLSTDLVQASIRTVGATPRTITSRSTNTDQVIVVFSGDPSTDHVIDYVVFRAV